MKKILVFAFLILIISSCNNTASKENEKDQSQNGGLHYLSDCKKFFNEARYMDSVLFTQTVIDTVSAQKAIIAFTQFANFCGSDTLSPIFLIKTAQVARAINNIPQAKIVLDKCIADYPNFENRPAALFLLGQLYDDNNYMNDENEAKRLYQKIIDEYPKSEWAASAKGAIAFIGKSDKEITNIIVNGNK